MTDLPLTKLSETATTVTFGWTPPVGAVGYYLFADGKRVSNSTDGTQKQARFKKVASGKYGVQALGVVAEGFFPAVTPPPVVASNHLAIKEYGDYNLSFGYDRYRAFICGEWASQSASKDLKTMVLPYTSAVSIRPDYWTCVDYDLAASQGWMLKHAGVDIYNAGYPAAKIGDLGLTAFRQGWVDSVLDHAQRKGWRGVFIDDVTRASVESGLTNTFPDKYPTQQAWQTAMVGHIDYIGQALQAAGLYVMINAAGFVSGMAGWDDGTATKQFATLLHSHVDAFCVEYWQQRQDTMGVRTLGPAWYQHWDGWQSIVPHVENLGMDFVGLVDAAPGDSPTAVYTKASLLLDADRPGSCLVVDGDHGNPWGALVGKDMGALLGPKTGTTRRFTNGTVTVDPVAGTATIS